MILYKKMCIILLICMVQACMCQIPQDLTLKKCYQYYHLFAFRRNHITSDSVYFCVTYWFGFLFLSKTAYDCWHVSYDGHGYCHTTRRERWIWQPLHLLSFSILSLWDKISQCYKTASTKFIGSTVTCIYFKCEVLNMFKHKHSVYCSS